jgi:hypothetical protein
MVRLEGLRTSATSDIEDVIAWSDGGETQDFAPIDMLTTSREKQQQHVVEARPVDTFVCGVSLQG